MRCPYCHNDKDRVVDTRPGDNGSAIRRRRECLACQRRFTTHERVEEMPLRVIKKSGEREPFSRENILKGIIKALEKRPVSIGQIEEMVDYIEIEVMECSDREISSAQIGKIVMVKLRELDAVAYVRFASVYREFKAVDEFLHEINSIEKGEKGCYGKRKCGGNNSEN